MTETGFDTEIALLELNEANVRSIIEEYTQQNLDILHETIYENCEPFKFLPGHRALLLAIPKRISSFKESKKQKRKNTTNHLQQPVDETATDAPDDLELEKKQLIEKLHKFCKNINLFLDLSLGDISDFIVLNDRIRCRVSCPYCQNKYWCLKKKHWAVSNIESHLKKHKEQMIAEQEQSSEPNATEKNTDANTFVNDSVSSKVSSELDKILQT